MGLDKVCALGGAAPVSGASKAGGEALAKQAKGYRFVMGSVWLCGVGVPRVQGEDNPLGSSGSGWGPEFKGWPLESRRKERGLAYFLRVLAMVNGSNCGLSILPRNGRSSLRVPNPWGLSHRTRV